MTCNAEAMAIGAAGESETAARDLPEQAAADDETAEGHSSSGGNRPSRLKKCLRAAVALVGLSVCCLFALYAAMSGKLAGWLDSLADLPYSTRFIIINAAVILMNMPFAYGYSVVVISFGFAFGWSAAPAALLSGLLLGPWLAFWTNRYVLFRGSTPEGLTAWLPNATARRWVRAVLEGIKHDSCRVLIVMATRNSPIAMGLQHVILCAAGPPFWVHAVGMFFGGIPDILLGLYVGILVRSATDQATDTVDGVKMGIVIGQGCAVLVATSLMGFSARRMLRKYHRNSQAPGV